MVRRTMRLLARGATLLLLLCSANLVCGSDQLEVPPVLPDGSQLTSIRDVFTEVADTETAQQLRAHMPRVLGGTEYRYVYEENSEVESEWGIVVFDFADEQVALESFQHLAKEAATVNRNPYFTRIEGAEDVPEIQEFLNSDLEYACLMNEIVIFRMGTRIIWVDDYSQTYGGTTRLGSPATVISVRSLATALQISERLHSQAVLTVGAFEPRPTFSELLPPPTGGKGSIRLVVTDHEGNAIDKFRKDADAFPFTQMKPDVYARVAGDPFVDLGEWEFPPAQPARPVAPQDFNTYEMTVPGIWYAVYSLESDSIESVVVSSIEAGQQEVVIGGLDVGRYLIQCGTTIQLEATETIDTGVKVPPEGGTPEAGFPPVPLVGDDEKGHWETFLLKQIGQQFYDVGNGIYETHYTYEIRKRYTYNIVASTVTQLGSDEVSAGEADNAFVCLLTHTDALALLCGGAEYTPFLQDETEQDLDETLMNSAVKAAGAKGLGETFKYPLPQAAKLSTGVNYGPGLLGTEIANLVYLAYTQPDMDLDEEFLVKFGASLAVKAIAIKVGSVVGTAVGGPAGTVTGYAVAVIGTTLVEEAFKRYKKGQLREKAAVAFFDDVVVCLERDKQNVVTRVGASCNGTVMLSPYVAETLGSTLTSRTAGQSNSACLECLPGADRIWMEVAPYGGIQHGLLLNPDCKRHPIFGYWIGGTSVLVADVPLIAAPGSSCSQKSWLLDDLTWCLNDLVVECLELFADLSVTDVATNPESVSPGEVVVLGAMIENGGSDAERVFSVRAVVDGVTVSTAHVNSLASSDSALVTFPQTWAATPGTHTITVEVDFNNDVAESDEANNSRSETLVVGDLPVPPTLPPTATVLVMDVSGSMDDRWKGERKIDAARRAALDFIEHVAREAQARGTDHRIGVVAFSDTAQVLLPLTDDYDRARQTVVNLHPQARTNIGDGLVKGLDQLVQMEEGQRFIILLSDGQSNAGMSKPQILSGPVARAKRKGICIHTVGFGDGSAIDATFLRRIAQESGCGTYGHAETPTQLFYTYVRARHTALGNIVGEFSAIEERVVMIPEMPAALGTLVLLGQEDELHYTLAWSEDGTMSAQLRDPSGQVYNATEPGGVAYSGERFSYMMVSSPERGVWTVEAVPAFDIDEETEYYAVVSTRPGGSAIAVSVPTLRIGEWEFALPAGLPGWLLLVATVAVFALQLYLRSR